MVAVTPVVISTYSSVVKPVVTSSSLISYVVFSVSVQFINLKSYDEAYLLRQCFTISITTSKTVTQTQTKPICLSNVDSFFSFMVSDRFSSRVLEVVSLSAFTSVLSLIAVSFLLFLLKSPENFSCHS